MSETNEPKVLDQPILEEAVIPAQTDIAPQQIVVHGEGAQPVVELQPLEPAMQAKIEEEFQSPVEVNDAELVEAHGMELPNYAEVLQEAGDQQVEAHHQSELMAEWVDEQDPQSKQDFELYLARRPFKDSQGAPRTADGKVLGKRDRINERVAQEEGEQYTSREEYEEMGMVHLARLIGRAESEEDRTTVQDLSDILLAKLESKEKDSGLSSEQLAKFYDRLMKAKDAYRELWPQLRADLEKKDQEKSISEQRDRIDVDRAERVMNGLKGVGVGDEALQQIPAEELYKKDDPGYVDGKTEEIVEILENHQAQTEEQGGEDLTESSHTDQASEERLEPLPELSWRDRVKARLMTKAGEAYVKLFGEKRGRVAMAVGVVVAAGVGFKIGLSLADQHDSASQIHQFGLGVDLPGGLPAKAQSVQEINDAVTVPSPHHAVHAEVFDVHSGDGVTNTIQDAAQQHGVRLSDASSYQLYQQHEEELRRLANTYTMANGEIGIADPSKDLSLPSALIEDIEKAKK